MASVIERCPSCSSLPRRRCDRCYGTGDVTIERRRGVECIECPGCDGDGYHACPRCNGYGCLVAAWGEASAGAWAAAPKDAVRLLLQLSASAAAQDGPGAGRWRYKTDSGEDWAYWLGIRLAAKRDVERALRDAGFRKTTWRDAVRPKVREWVWTSDEAHAGLWVGDMLTMAPAPLACIEAGPKGDETR